MLGGCPRGPVTVSLGEKEKLKIEAKAREKRRGARRRRREVRRPQAGRAGKDSRGRCGAQAAPVPVLEALGGGWQAARSRRRRPSGGQILDITVFHG